MSAEIELKEQIKTYKKLENIDVENEAFEPKAYLTELNLSQARIKFKLRNIHSRSQQCYVINLVTCNLHTNVSAFSWEKLFSQLTRNTDYLKSIISQAELSSILCLNY